MCTEEKEGLWGVECTLAVIGTEEDPRDGVGGALHTGGGGDERGGADGEVQENGGGERGGGVRGGRG
eukprot:5711174-Pyramimonas_sp.AAC.2